MQTSVQFINHHSNQVGMGCGWMKYIFGQCLGLCRRMNLTSLIFEIFITAVSFGEYPLYCPVYNYRVQFCCLNEP